MQAIPAVEMRRNRLQHLRESAPGAGDGLLPAGMCMFSVVVIGLATAVALFGAWAKMSHSAERQTPAIHTPQATERHNAKATSRITPGDGNGAADMSAAEPARQNTGAAVQPR